MIIGLTIFPPKTGFSVWSNGAHQNVLSLYLLLTAGGHDVRMLNGGDGDPPADDSLPPEVRGLTYARIGDVVDSLDVLIEAGAQVAKEHVDRVHARGGKAIAFRFGNSFVIEMERSIHNLPSGAILNGAQFDEVWTTSQHVETCASYWETLHRCPVRVLPHIWHPCFIDAMCTALNASGVVTGYQPGRAKKKIAILEPNINFVKTCHIPMLICEWAFRMRPELIEQVHVGNSFHMRKRLVFETMVGALDIAKTKAADGFPVMTFEGRFNLPYTLAKHADVVVSHGWIDTPTYLHYDVLHLGYPLVHNICSEWDMPGYKYKQFRVDRGGQALIDAMLKHDRRDETYRSEARAYLGHRMATSQTNIDAHARALVDVCGR